MPSWTRMVCASHSTIFSMDGAQHGQDVFGSGRVSSEGARQVFLIKALSQRSSFLSGRRSSVRQVSTCRSDGHSSRSAAKGSSVMSVKCRAASCRSPSPILNEAYRAPAETRWSASLRMTSDKSSRGTCRREAQAQMQGVPIRNLRSASAGREDRKKRSPPAPWKARRQTPQSGILRGEMSARRDRILSPHQGCERCRYRFAELRQEIDREGTTCRRIECLAGISQRSCRKIRSYKLSGNSVLPRSFRCGF